MQEECYVLLHWNSISSHTAQQHRQSPILHPALRKIDKKKEQGAVAVVPAIHPHPPSVFRSNSAPACTAEPSSDHTNQQNRTCPARLHSMNGTSAGDKANTISGLKSRHHQDSHYQQQQPNQQQKSHLRNGHIFRQADSERLAFSRLSTGTSTYSTHWTSACGSDGSTTLSEYRPSIHVPVLDLTAITLDDGENDTNSNIKSKGLTQHEQFKDPILSTEAPRKHVMVEEKFGIKKQHKSPFVFPCEKSLADFDVVRTTTSHVVYEDPASTSPFGQKGWSLSTENMSTLESSKQEPPQKYQHHQSPTMQKHLRNQELPQERDSLDPWEAQKVIHFSLANPKLGKYILDEESPSPAGQSHISLEEPQRTRESMVESKGINEKEGSMNSPRNEGFVRRASDAAHNMQEIVDVVVVDGHLQVDIDEKEHRGEENDDVVQDLKLENIIPEPAKGKTKARVTFSFNHEIQSCRSLKRYTPIKMDIKPLQGVLKKRPEPTKVFDSNENDRSEGSKETYFNDSNTVFRKSSKPQFVDQGGIRVKHLHTTNFDISREAGKRGATIPSTICMSEKPPIPVSRRLALAAAENTALGLNTNNSNSNNLTFAGGLTYICSNAQGRAAYFRPSDVAARASDLPNSHNNHMKVKSRSTDDINVADAGRFFSAAPTYHIHNRQQAPNRKATNHGPTISSPYTLRRSISTDQGFATSGSGGGVGSTDSGSNKPTKPRVAFGSFIVPKETTPRLKKAQIKYQEVENANRPTLGNGGTYIHTHTRRTSPYSAPTQVLYERSASTSGPPGFRRPYTAKVSKTTRSQQVSTRTYNKDSSNLPQRHSAPSSYSAVRDRAWRASVARQRISIDNSPSQGGDVGGKDQLNHQSSASSGNVGGGGGGGGSASSFLPSSRTRSQQASSDSQVPLVGKSSGAAQILTTKPNTGVERLAVRSLSRPDLSALNMLANRDRGSSQTRFLATLNKIQKKE
ncbi:hypothetical protein EGW08_009166 [Elysia chlorotica]|uniref:Uncharacterized protein n=1 Tax=Elysia chlorotica TaxID=188477 RepID=A0A433TNF5_ELYCH|nr:hypothetical protein EGW08_009166 [Elysia chlorotica]